MGKGWVKRFPKKARRRCTYFNHGRHLDSVEASAKHGFFGSVEKDSRFNFQVSIFKDLYQRWSGFMGIKSQRSREAPACLRVAAVKKTAVFNQPSGKSRIPVWNTEFIKLEGQRGLLARRFIRKVMIN